MMDATSIRQRYQLAGQDHVFQYYDTLSLSEKELFLQQLHSIQVEQIQSLFELAQQTDQNNQNNNDKEHSDHVIQPFLGRIGRTDHTDDDHNDHNTLSRSIGLECIRRKEIATIVLAGGQGTRLGYSGPKGMYDIGLPSGYTLFELIAKRLQKISHLAYEYSNNNNNNNNNNNVQIASSVQGEEVGDSSSNSSLNQPQLVPLYVMTSPINHEETVEYFKQNNYFDLGTNNVYFFQQGMLPCLTHDGKMILESAGLISMAPDGNGGIYPSLQNSGALRNIREQHTTVKYLHVFSIDNALVQPADPLFMGYCIEQNADCGNKVVYKTHPHEKVGVMASKNGRPCIVEYSEITKEMAECTDERTGQLLYGAGNICNHFYTLHFLEQTILPNMGHFYHIARKKIPYYDSESRTTITPTNTENGLKLETFIFDVFPLSERMTVLAVQRDEEFAPVKNRTGTDSPETTREMISTLAKKYLQKAGAILIEEQHDNNNNQDSNNNNNNTNICELSPLITYAGEGLESYKGKEIKCPFRIL